MDRARVVNWVSGCVGRVDVEVGVEEVVEDVEEDDGPDDEIDDVDNG